MFLLDCIVKKYLIEYYRYLRLVSFTLRFIQNSSQRGITDCSAWVDKCNRSFRRGSMEKEVKKLTHYSTKHWLKYTIQIGADYVKKIAYSE